MARKLSVVAFLVICTAGSAGAQIRQENARTVLENSLKAMGGANLKSIQYSAGGTSTIIGQTYGLSEDWPRYEVANYTRLIDYDNHFSREDYTRRQGNNPAPGRPPMPEQQITAIASGPYAWDLDAGAVVPQTRNLYLYGVPYGDLRQLEIAITPHGFLKAALAASDAAAVSLPIVGPSDFGLSQYGQRVTIVSFTFLGKYKINGTINAENLVELVGTAFPNPVYGDMAYEMRYTQYKDWGGGLMFPAFIHVHQGDPRLNPAHNYYNYTVTAVKANVSVPSLPVPEAVRAQSPAPVKVESTKLADGVWMIAGGSHNSLLVEFKDYVAIVEAPQNEQRSLAVINEAARLVPGKPVNYVVNTHHHFDHAGGLRTYLAMGTTIVTAEMNKDYYLDILFHPGGWTLQPDLLARFEPMYMISRRPAPIETVGKKYVITDGAREMQVLQVRDVAYELGDNSYRQGNHSADMLMVYLPKEKILYNADLYSPPAPGAASAPPDVRAKTLYQNIRLQKLDVATHVPAHGPIGSHDQFLKGLGTLVSRSGN